MLHGISQGESSAMSKRLRREISTCCLSTSALSLLYLVVMPTVCATDPYSKELIGSLGEMLEDANGMSSIAERLYTPNATDYEKCPKSILKCFAEEVKVLEYHNPAFSEYLLFRRLISINTRDDRGYCPQCEVNNMEPVKTFLKTLLSIVQQINAHG